MPDHLELFHGAEKLTPFLHQVFVGQSEVKQRRAWRHCFILEGIDSGYDTGHRRRSGRFGSARARNNRTGDGDRPFAVT
jgi:hypothetical protein